jgi:hypothetical protein
MGHAYWTAPVDVLYPNCGRAHAVTTTVHACEHLLTNWPDRAHLPSYYQAILACFDAIDGKHPHSAARLAFVAAARDARICQAR